MGCHYFVTLWDYIKVLLLSATAGPAGSADALLVSLSVDLACGRIATLLSIPPCTAFPDCQPSMAGRWVVACLTLSILDSWWHVIMKWHSSHSSAFLCIAFPACTSLLSLLVIIVVFLCETLVLQEQGWDKISISIFEYWHLAYQPMTWIIMQWIMPISGNNHLKTLEIIWGTLILHWQNGTLIIS